MGTNSVLFTLVLLQGLTLLTSAAPCPPFNATLDNPCICDEVESLMECRPNVTQKEFDLFFREVLAYSNNATGLDVASFDLFRLTDSELTSLQVDSMTNFRFTNFQLLNSRNLRQLTVNLGVTCVVENFQVLNADGSAEGINFNAFLLANKGTIRSVDVQFSSISTEFLKGLYHLTDLEVLHLQNNHITELSKAEFKSGRLMEIGLENNRIHNVGPETFDLELPQYDIVDAVLTINLTGNLLTDGNFSPLSGISTLKRPTTLDLTSNNFVYISQEAFETFLFSNRNNALRLEGNTFICDGRMKWVKDATVLLENRVTGVDCLNDPGKTIFTTTLVS